MHKKNSIFFIPAVLFWSLSLPLSGSDNNSKTNDSRGDALNEVQTRAEAIYQNLHSQFESEEAKSEIESEHQNWLKSLSDPSATLRQKIDLTTSWLDTWKAIEKPLSSLPHDCPDRRYLCKKLTMGTKQHPQTIYVHFQDSGISTFRILEVLWPDGRTLKQIHVPPSLEFDLGAQLDLDSVDCEKKGTKDLVIGHSSARDTNWERLKFKPLNRQFATDVSLCKALNED